MFTLKMSTDNAAFEPEPSGEIMRILKNIHHSISEGAKDGTCRDINGNTVGKWEIE